MAKTKIEWTDRTWNPITGCTKVSPGCDNCYAETIAHRFAGQKSFPDGFAVTPRANRLDEPLRWRQPSNVFVNSMSDLFHEDVSRDFLLEVFAVMALAPRHRFQILTKRHGVMRATLRDAEFWYQVGRTARHRGYSYNLAEQYLADGTNIYDTASWQTRRSLPNVWLGVSVEDQKRADLRIPALLDTPAAVRFLSCEPLLGPIDLTPWMPAGYARSRCSGCLRFFAGDLTAACPSCGRKGYLTGSHTGNGRPNGQPLGWVIVGGESGRRARPMQPAWAREIRDQCTAAGVPYFFKQWGEWIPVPEQDGLFETDHDVRADGYHWPISQPHGAADGTEVVMRRVGKQAAGRHLDGRTWDELPPAAAVPA
jgi:protein gp37